MNLLVGLLSKEVISVQEVYLKVYVYECSPCMYKHHVYMLSRRAEEVTGASGTGIMGGCEGWELNLGRL